MDMARSRRSCTMMINALLLIGMLATLVMPEKGVDGSSVKPASRDHSRLSGLFVFGDSYADTGNHDPTDPSLSSTWRFPYGSTWPGIPTGRFSDGRVLTDYFAEHLHVFNPIPYRVINLSTAFGPHSMVASVNFAFGGSGVFPTFGPLYPNISTQINQFKDLLQKSIITNKTIKSSIALLVIAGNDYTAYANLHPDNKGVMEFSAKVVGQMKINLQELYALGFRRFAVTNIEPFGCFPQTTKLNNYTSCNNTASRTSDFHNKFLSKEIYSLRNALQDAKFNVLDIHNAFLQILQGSSPNLRIERQSCCEAIGDTGNCAAISGNGQPLYTLCSSPRQHFFWDVVHPSDHGWKLVSKILFKK